MDTCDDAISTFFLIIKASKLRKQCRVILWKLYVIKSSSNLQEKSSMIK